MMCQYQISKAQDLGFRNNNILKVSAMLLEKNYKQLLMKMPLAYYIRIKTIHVTKN